MAFFYINEKNSFTETTRIIKIEIGQIVLIKNFHKP